MKSTKLKEEILNISEGIFSTVVDLVLWEFIYISESATTFSRDTWTPSMKADNFLEKINYETIKRAIAHAREKGWIERTHKKHTWPEISKEGRRHLGSIIPKYDKKRTWNKQFYLVTYDISEKRRRDRQRLREYLKSICAGMIQESVWLTPYDPTDGITDFVEEKDLSGSIIVSSIGKDGSIGSEDIKDLIKKVYRLDEINNSYKEFLDKYSKAKKWVSQITFSYWKILNNDPQLPFELLPSDWRGEDAYKLFLKFGMVKT